MLADHAHVPGAPLERRVEEVGGGARRLRDPVDVFLWDLEQDKLVLRSRTENRGRLITVRSQIGPGAESAKAAGDPIVTADCSIAAHIKAQLGEPTMDLATPD